MKVLKIGATWCPDCKVMVPRWEEIEQENSWLETEMIKVDEKPEIMNQHHVMSLPTFIFLDKEGNEIQRFSGIVEKDVLVKALLENRDK